MGMNKQRKCTTFSSLKKLRFSRRGLDYALSMMVVVVISLSFLFLQLTTKVENSKRTLGDTEMALMKAPYMKENLITYLEKSAELSLPEVLAACSTGLTPKFNQELDKYIDAYNAQSPVTKIPKNNYELYIEDKNIHAIAILPVKQDLTLKGLELENIGNIWFAPSFTISASTDQSTCIV